MKTLYRKATYGVQDENPSYVIERQEIVGYHARWTKLEEFDNAGKRNERIGELRKAERLRYNELPEVKNNYGY